MTDARVRAGFYPGTFDPVTNGHLDIIARASRLVGRLVIGVAKDTTKQPLLSLQERIACLRTDIAALGLPPSTVIEVVGFEGLLVNAAHAHGAHAIFRGLRAVADFDYENQMSAMNTHLAPDIETVFLMARQGNQYISSRLVKEIARLEGDITDFVSPSTRQCVLAHLQGR